LNKILGLCKGEKSLLSQIFSHVVAAMDLNNFRLIILQD